MARKGPDGQPLPDSDATAPVPEDEDGATRRMARRSIRDRIASVDQAPEAETRAVHRPDDNEQTAAGPSPARGQDAGDYEETRLTDGVGGPAASASKAPGAAPAGVGSTPTQPMTPADAAEPVDRPVGDDPTGPGSDPPVTAPAAAGRPAAGAPAVAPNAPPDTEVTQLYRPNRNKAGDDRANETGEDMNSDGLVADPVVGWLVVVDGPGRGTAIAIGYGNNRVGRDSGEDIVLDFGDGQISRENHAVITYDGKNRRFYIQQGAGRNLTHLDDELVMTPMEMKGAEIVHMGDTQMRFVPLCGPEFDWYQDDGDSDGKGDKKDGKAE